MPKLIMDDYGNVTQVSSANTNKRLKRYGNARFTCDECGGLKYETGLNVCRSRSDIGLDALKKYNICCKCYVLNQSKYINDDPASGIYFTASLMHVELKPV